MNLNDSKASETTEIEQNADSNDWGDFDESILEQIELDKPFELNNSRLRTDDKYNGFDNNSADSWIYPTNFPVRSYQFNITQVSLFRNTLVVLPTGLGKTFIAAVVMYNIYRWYPQGKVIFMAPTRPLVSQQIDACCKIMGIPTADTAEMTGSQKKESRCELWQSKRVFFATPQSVKSDIIDDLQNFPFDAIKLVVIDEAHKAKGRYAYTEVVQTIHSRNPYFRVLALSATPGRRVEDVTEIVRNLFISHLEVRCENSIDVRPYLHKKNVRIVPVPLGEKLSRIHDELVEIIDPYIRGLQEYRVLSGNVGNLNCNWLIVEWQKFKRMCAQERHPHQSDVSTCFSTAVSLYRALELLERHGLRVFLNHFKEENGRDKFFVAMNPALNRLLERCRQEVGPDPFAVSDQTMPNGEIPEIPADLDFGHPKFDMARKFIVEHFTKNAESKAIVFCEYRESVNLMHLLLLQSRPLVKPRVFVGQGGSGRVTQKQQLEIMSDFRSGVCNTLIATSVAEEGIDVGEVDLIICFDINTKNPIRIVQRIGRTGRKRQGYVVMLATEGKEHALVKEVLASKDKTNQKLAKSPEIQANLYRQSPRIVPPEFDPKCVKMLIEVEENAKNAGKKPAKESAKGGKKAKKTIPASQDMRNYFKKKEPQLEAEEQEIFDAPGTSSHLVELSEIQEVINETSVDESHINATKIFQKLEGLREGLDEPAKHTKFKGVSAFVKSKKYANSVKRFVLEKDHKYVQEKFEAMQAVWVLDSEGVSVETKEEKKLKAEYAVIEQIFGSREEIERYLAEFEVKNSKVISDKHAAIFEGMDERDFFDCNQNFINEKLKEIENLSVCRGKDESHQQSQQSIAYDEPCEVEFVDTFDERRSKYASQFENFQVGRMKNQSTPLRKDMGKKAPLKFDESPIVKAFSKAKERQESLTKFFESSFGLETSVAAEVGHRTEEKESEPKKEEKEDKLSAISEELEIIDEEALAESIRKRLKDESQKQEKEGKESVNLFKSVSDLFDDDFDDLIASNAILLDDVEGATSHKVAEKLPTTRKRDQQNSQAVQSTKSPGVCNSFPAISKALEEQRSQEISGFKKFSDLTPSTRKSFDDKSSPNTPKRFANGSHASNSYKLKESPRSPRVCNSFPAISRALKEQASTVQRSSQKCSGLRRLSALTIKSIDFPIDDQNSPKTPKSTMNRSHASNVSTTPDDVIEGTPKACRDRVTVSKLPSVSDCTTPSSMVEVSQFVRLIDDREKELKSSTAKSSPPKVSPAKSDFVDVQFDDWDLSEFMKPSDELRSSGDSHKENKPTATAGDTIVSRQPSDELFQTTVVDLTLTTSPKRSSTPLSKPPNREISPSVIQRKPSSLRMKLFKPSLLKTLNSEQGPRTTNSMQPSPRLQGKLSMRLNATRTENETADESVIRVGAKRTAKRAFIESSTGSSQSEDFDVLPDSQEVRSSRIARVRNHRKRQRQRCAFVDDEAQVSDDDEDDPETNTYSHYMLDSIVVSDDDVEDHPSVNMQAKYLQSVRSPTHRRGNFKIPAPREYKDMSRIFSQAVPEESISAYKEDDSFVVSDDDDDINEVSDICPLERAERILKERRRAKRKAKSGGDFEERNVPKRKRIIARIIESSDEE